MVAFVCPKCGDARPHYVPPCFGEEGFFACDIYTDRIPDSERPEAVAKDARIAEENITEGKPDSRKREPL